MTMLKCPLLFVVLAFMACTAVAQRISDEDAKELADVAQKRMSDEDAKKLADVAQNRMSDEDAKKLADAAKSFAGPSKGRDDEMKGFEDTDEERIDNSGAEVCYNVKKPSVWTDGDCCCPTVPHYYQPQAFEQFNTTWYPLNLFNQGQWVKGGKCLNFGPCGSSSARKNNCIQQYERKGFLVYRLKPCQIRYMYFSIPDYCSCPHCYSKQIKFCEKKD